jgi:deoxyguanosine kinase
MYIAIEGVIGVGKTTLARLLQPALKPTCCWRCSRRIRSSPIFTQTARAMRSRRRSSFCSAAITNRTTMCQRYLAAGKSLIADYTFAKDALFARINLKGDELDMYHKVHEALGEKIPKPNLLVYLQASTDTLMQRIAFRDRPYERQMERSYIDELNVAYEEFFSKPFDHTPVLKIDTNDLNIIQNTEHIKLIENRIREALGLAPFQPALPLT